MKHIICFHLYNDYSGSPKVLKEILSEFLKVGYIVDLITSKGGVLDELQSENLNNIRYNYCYSKNHVITFFKYIWIQLITFFIAIKYINKKDTVFYINTLLPIGAAFAGKLIGKKIIYHYHENAFAKGFFYKALAQSMTRLANIIICVSAYQASFLKRNMKIRIIPNALPKEFKDKLKIDIQNAFERKCILMLSSLKRYKGPLEFIKLSQIFQEYTFNLVINDTKTNIKQYIKENKISIPKNLSIIDRQDDVSPFYNKASLVLNLTNKNEFIETFGLTALEAMSCALPVIVPTVGGISEMVTDGYNGYKVDVQNLDKISILIKNILSDYDNYASLANNAYKYSKQFVIEDNIKRIIKLI